MKNTTGIDYYKKVFHKEIFYENIKRNQVYSILNYLINFSTYFDFFSIDAFNLIALIKYILTINNKKLRNFYINKSKSNVLKLLLKNKINSEKLNILLKHIINNNLLKLSIPIITVDTILFTYIEKNQYILRSKPRYNFIFYLMKYNIIKKIYNHEIAINNINKNEKLFLFLFKSQISENSFAKLANNKNLDLAVFIFRNLIISKILKINFNYLIKKEVNISCKRNNNRSYIS